MAVFVLLGGTALAAPGLDARPANTTCLAPVRAVGAGSVSADWLNADVGAVATAGSFTRAGTLFTVRGSGADIWGAADEFQFAHRLLTGDGDVIARVTGLTSTDPWAKAGLMIRESLAPGSRFALMMMTPGSNGASFHYRTTTGGSAAPNNSADQVSTIPRWLKISRRGNAVSGYSSTNGTTWTLRDSVTLALPATAYAGLAVTSHKDGTLATGTFDSVQVVPGAGTASAPTSMSVEDPFPTTPAFTQPTKLLQAPGDAARWFVLEKTGRAKVFRTDTPATVSTWLDFSAKVNTSSEGGLLSLAFHPLYPARREVFVSYTTGSPMQLVVSRLLLNNVTTPTVVTEQMLLTVSKPWDNHNGGDLAFGPDGHLYISTGDGGSGGDPNDYAQNRTRLLGKMLRIDAWDATGWPAPRYRIPPDNTYAGNALCGPATNAAACPELYAWGLRNPWRFSFDASTGSLWAGDVGQNLREEIDVITRGGNYGWRCREGIAAYNTAGCPASGLIEPVFDYTHTSGNASITGGYVYRGNGIPELRGRYVYGDFASGRIWALKDDGAGGYQTDQLVDTAAGISSFAAGNDGELYFSDYSTGRLQRLKGSGAVVLSDVVPDDLAATGCVNPSNPRLPSGGAIPFAVNSPFWADGATKARHLAVPDGTKVTVTAGADWQFPAGSVLMKTMELAGKPVETRLLMRHPDGGWAGYTYEWDAAATRATRVRGGKTKFINGQDWIYPSEGQCQQCHTTAAGISLGPETGQLNGDQLYPATGRLANQLETLSHIGLITPAIINPASSPRIPSPTDTSLGLELRARAYLHSNCSNCHQPNGPTGMNMDLRYTLPLSITSTRTCDMPPQAGDLGIANARLIAPASPSRSILLQRMLRRDAHGMPPLGSALADAAGAQLISSWISQIQACDAGGGGGCHAADGSF
ncbi:MAG: PQQ-dependent sugar dehydrogenase [Gammaproteobacteria bacterium]